MVDRSCLFSAPMVRALIEGRKTQTRRPLYRLTKNFRSACFHNLYQPPRLDFEKPDHGPGQTWTLTPWASAAVGDRIWVREAWRTFVSLEDVSPCDLLKPGRGAGIEFEAGGGVSVTADEKRDRYYDFNLDHPREPVGAWGRKRASMHLPRWASRLTLIVEAVKVERLQEISRDDAVAEGIERTKTGRGYYDPTLSREASRAACRFGEWFTDSVPAYAALWNSLHGPGAWDANPWVAAITFRTVLGNIDAQEAKAA